MKNWTASHATCILVALLIANVVFLDIHMLVARHQFIEVSSKARESATTQPEADAAAALPIDPFELEWLMKSMSYVSGRPDLTGILDEEEIEYVRHRVGQYFEANGVKLQEVQNLSIAYRGDAGGLLVKFSLRSDRLERFIADMKPTDEPAERVLSELYETGSIFSVSVDGSEEGWTHFSHITQYPFIRLSWWPIPLPAAKGLTAYEAKTQWAIWQIPIGGNYYVFIDKKTGEGYLIGH